MGDNNLLRISSWPQRTSASASGNLALLALLKDSWRDSGWQQDLNERREANENIEAYVELMPPGEVPHTVTWESTQRI